MDKSPFHFLTLGAFERVGLKTFQKLFFLGFLGLMIVSYGKSYTSVLIDACHHYLESDQCFCMGQVGREPTK